MRLVSIDMTDTSSNCPSDLRTITSPHRLCAKNIDGAGCSSVVFPVQGVQYSRVCGKIIGYQLGSPDAFYPYIHRGQTTTDSQYFDEISLTHGTSPHKHGHLQQHFMSTPLIVTMYVPVLTHATLHLLQFLTLWDMTTSVTQAVRITSSSSSMELILSGMMLNVVHTTPAVPGTLHHGS